MIFSENEPITKAYLKNNEKSYKTVLIKCTSKGKDACTYVNDILENIEDNTIVSFETGTYLVGTAFLLKNKKNIIIEGNSSVFQQNFLSEEYGIESSDIFHVEDCKNVILRNFIIDSSVPVNVSGKITDVGDDYFDLKINNDIPFTGKEKYITGYTFSGEGYPTYGLAHPKELDKTTYDCVGGEICCTNPRVPDIPHEKIGEDTVRVSSFLREPDGSFLQNNPIEKGDTFCMRYAYYGPVACLFRNTRMVTVEDVTVRAFGGMVFVILPRCSDFIFNRVVLASDKPDLHFFTSNADLVHTIGLMGKLVIKNCMFRNCGDDVFNLHTQVMRADLVTERSFKVCYDKVKPYIAPTWAQPGDILYVYNPDTLERKKDIVVKSFEDNVVSFDSESDICADDIVINGEYCPEITIENCTCYNLRDRAYVIQGAKKLVIKNCEFYNVTGAAIYISAAFQKWCEAGLIENVEIYNNLISGCKTWTKNGYAAVNVWVRGEFSEKLHNIHKNIFIHDNVFKNIAGQPIYISATDGVKVKDNVFSGCKCKNNEIRLNGCSDCTLENNISL